MGKWMNGYLDRLIQNHRDNLDGGGKDRIEEQNSLGKLTARERIDRLVDPGCFDELGSLVKDPYRGRVENPKPSPTDGMVMGLGQIYSFDFTVMSGAIGIQGIWKLAELAEMAGREQVPLIGIIDSAGSRIGFKGGFSGLDGMCRLVRNYCLYSGIIPQITLLLGPCTGPMAQIPALSDFLIINRNTGFLWLGGEIASDEDGTAEFHMEKSGQCDWVADSDEEAIDLAKNLLDYIPQNCWEKPRTIESTDDPDRREEALLDVMPEDDRFTYDMHDIIELIVDNGEFFEVKEDFAPNLIAGLTRFDGMVAGIAASNPEELSGVMEPDSSDKYDKFLMFLDTFNIPLITMSDTTAYPPGDKWERLGVIRHGAKNLHGYAHLTNPKVTLVLRRSYGGSNISMGCSKMGPDFIYAWPTAEFAPTGPEQIVQAIFHKDLAKAKEEGRYEEAYNSYLAPLKARMNVLNSATSFYAVQEVIDPRDTRHWIVRSLRAMVDKHEELPEKKRYIKPA
jgi:acetyl-CoA carboxylase carboxyltransferase component